MELRLVSDKEARRPIRYQPLFDAIEAAQLAGKQEWVCVASDQIAGKNPKAKQAAIWQAATARGMRIETTVRDGFCYVRQSQPKQSSEGVA